MEKGENYSGFFDRFRTHYLWDFYTPNGFTERTFAYRKFCTEKKAWEIAQNNRFLFEIVDIEKVKSKLLEI